MKPVPSTREIRDALKRQRPAAMPHSDEFWGRFRARAVLAPQAPSEDAERGPVMWPRWATAGLAAAALVLFLFTVPFRGTPALSASPMLSTVDEVDVFVDYTTVMVVEDADNGATVVWVGGLEPAADG